MNSRIGKHAMHFLISVEPAATACGRNGAVSPHIDQLDCVFCQAVLMDVYAIVRRQIELGREPWTRAMSINPEGLRVHRVRK